MGCEVSKRISRSNSVYDDVKTRSPIESRDKKDGDINNILFMRACIDHHTGNIKTQIDNVDLISPYNNLPLIISAIMALLNDRDYDRFISNYDTVMSGLRDRVPMDMSVDVRLTNFSRGSGGSVPVIHVSNINHMMMPDLYTHIETVSMGRTDRCNVISVLSVIINNINRVLADVKDNVSTDKFESCIMENIKYSLDNIDNTVVRYDSQMNYDKYYEWYRERYNILEKRPDGEIAEKIANDFVIM